MRWQSGQSERVVRYKGTRIEETNTLILKSRYFFVHKVLITGLKHAEPELLAAICCLCLVGKVIPKPHVTFFLFACYSVSEAARVKIGCNSGSNKIPYRFDFV